MMTGSRKLSLLIVAILVATVFSYQNCTHSTSFSSASSGGNSGAGFDGKLYDLPDTAGVCQGGETVLARIKRTVGVDGSESFLLVRENCVDQPNPKDITSHVSPSDPAVTRSDFLVYLEQIFLRELNSDPLQLDSLDFKVYCTTNGFDAATPTSRLELGVDRGLSGYLSFAAREVGGALRGDVVLRAPHFQSINQSLGATPPVPSIAFTSSCAVAGSVQIVRSVAADQSVHYAYSDSMGGFDFRMGSGSPNSGLVSSPAFDLCDKTDFFSLSQSYPIVIQSAIQVTLANFYEQSVSSTLQPPYFAHQRFNPAQGRPAIAGASASAPITCFER